MEQSSEPEFEADVAIGKGLRFIDRNGSVTIAAGHLTLRKSKGDVIAEAPTSQVRVDRARFSGGGAAQIWMGDESYKIEPLRVTRHFGFPGAEGANLTGSMKRLAKGKELTQQFLEIVEAAGAQLGKP